MTTPSQSQVAASAAPRRSGVRALIVWMIGVSLVSAFLYVPYAIASSLRLDRETAGLRDAVTGAFADSGGWSRRVEIRLGGPVFGLARFVSSFSDVPDEVRHALRAARSAEVGVYQWHGADIEATRRLMASGSGTVRLANRDWTRVVSVRDGDESVAVFTPSEVDDDADTVELCVVVLADEELVVVSVEIDPAPLADLVQPHLHELSREMRAEARGSMGSL